MQINVKLTSINKNGFFKCRVSINLSQIMSKELLNNICNIWIWAIHISYDH